MRILLGRRTIEVTEALQSLRDLLQKHPVETQETILVDSMDAIPILSLCLLIGDLIQPTITVLLALSFSAQYADSFVQQLTEPTTFQVFQSAFLSNFSQNT